MKIKIISALILFLIIGMVSADEYGAMLDLDDKPYSLEFMSGSFIPQESIDLINIEKNNHFLVQFYNIPSEEEKKILENSGVKLITYMPNFAFFASALNDVNLESINKKNIRFISIIKPEWKLSPNIINDNLPTFAVDGEHVIIFVKYFDDVNVDSQIQLNVLNTIKSINSRMLKVEKKNIQELAKIDSIQWIEPYSGPLEDELEQSRARVKADQAASVYGLSGRTVRVLLYESGYPYDHADLIGRVIKADPTCFNSGHSTHTAGIIAGNGAINFNLRGMATQASIYSYCYDFASINYNNVFGIEDDYRSAIYTNSVDVASNSWGSPVSSPNCDQLGNYEQKSFLFDNIVRGSLGKKIPIIFSAGNERNDFDCGLDPENPDTNFYTLNTPKAAKNIITVGATNSDDDSMTQFSSWGPTDDGRIKPELVAPGAQFGGDGGITAPEGVDRYTAGVGTSFAAPHVTGVITLIQERIKTVETGKIPLPSTIKALLLNTADDLGNVGPDYKNGYGRLNALAALSNLNKTKLVEDRVVNNDIDLYKINNIDSSNIKITLAWDDVPGTLNSAKALINNLDLVLVSPSGIKYYPYILDPSNPSLSATKGKDNLNNVEQVIVSLPEVGEWKVGIVARSVPIGSQHYSLSSSKSVERLPGCRIEGRRVVC